MIPGERSEWSDGGWEGGFCRVDDRHPGSYAARRELAKFRSENRWEECDDLQRPRTYPSTISIVTRRRERWRRTFVSRESLFEMSE